LPGRALPSNVPRGADVITPDQLVLSVHIEVVLVAVAAFAMFPGPARINILLRPLGGLVSPARRRLIRLDRRVFRAFVVVVRHRCDGRVKDLPATRDIALPRRIPVELREKFIDHARLRQSFPAEPNRLRVRHTVPKAQAPGTA
jgi:hypothetical protein